MAGRYQDGAPLMQGGSVAPGSGAFGPQGGYNFRQPGGGSPGASAYSGGGDAYAGGGGAYAGGQGAYAGGQGAYAGGQGAYAGGQGAYAGGGGMVGAGAYGDPGEKSVPMPRSNEMNDVFFGAAMCVVLGSILGGTCLAISMKAVEFLQLTYLLIFSTLLAVMDTPILKGIKAVGQAKLYIGKYFSLITRVTGKGATLIFLGSALFMTLWDNVETGFVRFMAVVLCLFPVLVGIAAVVIGFLKSARLDKARKQLQHVVDHDTYSHFAARDGGITMDGFNDFSHSNSGIKFEKLDLQLIFNALSSNPAWRAQVAASSQPGSKQGYGYVGEVPMLPKQDVVAWTKGGFVFL